MCFWVPLEAQSGYLVAANVVSFCLLFLRLLCAVASSVCFHVRFLCAVTFFVRFSHFFYVLFGGRYLVYTIFHNCFAFVCALYVRRYVFLCVCIHVFLYVFLISQHPKRR